MLFLLDRICITKVCNFALIQFCTVDDLKTTDDKELFFKLAYSYFWTGRTPMLLSPRTLARISPPPHLDENVNLPSFTNLNQSFNHTEARCSLCGFFITQIFQEAVKKNLRSEAIIINVLKEVLYSLSVLMLKSKDENDDSVLRFQEMTTMVKAYMEIVNNDIEEKLTCC